MQKVRRLDLDILKGMSIIAVVLYHVGLLPYGYLGVDTFLVISGFLTIPSILQGMIDNSFSYFDWLQRRIFRFLPLILIASVFCLLVGYWTMIPDSYENLSEAIVASSVFCENILSAITTKDYWNAANEYKPLMHFWYLGILVQFYICYPLVLLFVKRICKRCSSTERLLTTTIFLMTLISFVCFILPQFTFNEKFYYLPFRIWEFGVGGLVGVFFYQKEQKEISISNIVYLSVFSVLVGCFCCHFKSLSAIDNITIVGFNAVDTESILSKDVLLITVVMMSSILILKNFKMGGGKEAIC